MTVLVKGEQQMFLVIVGRAVGVEVYDISDAEVQGNNGGHAIVEAVKDPARLISPRTFDAERGFAAIREKIRELGLPTAEAGTRPK